MAPHLPHADPAIQGAANDELLFGDADQVSDRIGVLRFQIYTLRTGGHVLQLEGRRVKVETFGNATAGR